MKVVIIGTRGIPAKYGGFETFAQEISTRLVKRGFDVTVICPSNIAKQSEYKGVKLIYTESNKDDAPMKYYFESVTKSIQNKFDIILTCGQGGYAYIPHLWRLRSKRPIFITNTDGIEHRRTKWNKFVRLGVRLVGEMTSVLTSDILVADSKGIKDYLLREYRLLPKKNIFTIEYGAEVIENNDYPMSIIKDFGLTENEYHLVVSRLEPENNVECIIEGYKLSKTNKPLVVVGNLKDTPFVKKLQNISQDSNIIFLGGIYDADKLKALRVHAASYLHGHSVGGTNPSLLEALGAGNIVIGHDNPFNREVTDNKMLYFNTPEECAKAIDTVDSYQPEQRKELSDYARDRIRKYYNWDRICDEYAKMFNEVKVK